MFSREGQPTSLCYVAALWRCMWGWGLRGNNADCSALCQLSVTSSATHKQNGPSADSWMGGFVYVLGPCGFLQWTLLWGWGFSHHLSPHRFFQSKDLRLYFPALEPWVVPSVSLHSCSSQFICTHMCDHLLCQPPPCLPWSSGHCLATSPLCPVARLCPSSQPGWMFLL